MFFPNLKKYPQDVPEIFVHKNGIETQKHFLQSQLLPPVHRHKDETVASYSDLQQTSKSGKLTKCFHLEKSAMHKLSWFRHIFVCISVFRKKV